MAVVFDAVTPSSNWSSSPEPFTFTHTPVGTPRGIILFIEQIFSGADTVDGTVSYGGVSMSRVRDAFDTGGESGATYCYFLGASIPTGAQTVSISHTEAAITKRGICISVTASADTSVNTSGELEDDQSDPQIALDSGGTTTLRFACISSGHGSLTSLSEVADTTLINSTDYGDVSTKTVRQDSGASGSFTMGWTATSNDVAMVAVAIAEGASSPATGVARILRHRGY